MNKKHNSFPIQKKYGKEIQQQKKKLWRKSTKISLIFLASISVSACSQYENAQRKIYRNRQDCIKDWQDSSLCERYKTDSETGYDYYQGPRYRIRDGKMYVRDKNDRYIPAAAGVGFALQNNSRSVGRINVKTPVTRGGFGRGASVRGSGG